MCALTQAEKDVHKSLCKQHTELDLCVSNVVTGGKHSAAELCRCSNGRRELGSTWSAVLGAGLCCVFISFHECCNDAVFGQVVFIFLRFVE